MSADTIRYGRAVPPDHPGVAALLRNPGDATAVAVMGTHPSDLGLQKRWFGRLACLPPRQDQVRWANMLPTALAHPSTAPYALSLIECDGQSPVQAIDSAILTVSKISGEVRGRVSAGLASALRHRWQTSSTEPPWIVIGEPGSGARAIVEAVAERTGRAMQPLDIPDLFKTAAFLPLFQEAYGQSVLIYTESPPTPVIRFLLDGFDARFVLLHRQSRVLGEVPTGSVAVDVSATTGDSWGADGTDAALLSWEYR